MSNRLLVYGRPRPENETGARKYHGAVSDNYDEKREKQAKWWSENRIVKGYLAGYPKGTKILDCPVGTGRFLDLYKERGFNVVAIDASEDQLEKARAKGPFPNVLFRKGDVRKLDLLDNSVDVAVMVRMTRWLSPDECRKAIRNLKRIAKSAIIFTARVRNHPHERPYDLFTGDGWKITRDEPADGEDYRVIMMEPE